MNALYWLFGQSSVPVPVVRDPELTVESFVFVEAEDSDCRADIERLREKLPQFPIHAIDLSTSICCVSDAAEQVRALTVKVPRPISQSASIEENGPYALAFWSQVEKSDSQFSKSLYFLDSSVLASRGYMDKMEDVQLLHGKAVSCSSQVFLDLPRWGKNAHFILDGKAHALSGLKESLFSIGVNHQRETPFKLLSLLDSVRHNLGDDKVFTLFTRYFHQGPFNDMVYSIMADCMSQWDASLIPEQKEMNRTFNLVYDTACKVHKLIISVSGYFNAGYVPDVGTLEPVPGRKLGTFQGVTIINLNTGAAFVRTFVERENKKWKAV